MPRKSSKKQIVEETKIDNVEVVTEETPIPPANEDDIFPDIDLGNNENDIVEDIVVETDAAEPKEVKVINMKTASPFNLKFNSFPEAEIGTLCFLCRDEDDKLFVLNKNIVILSEDDKINMECLPFAEGEFDFYSRKIACNTVNMYLDSYVSEFKFYVDDKFATSDNPVIYTYAINPRDNSNVRINMSPDTFSCIAFIDDYAKAGIDNEHDLALACIAGSKVLEDNVEIAVVDSISKIESMAPAVVEDEPMSWFEKIKNFFTRKNIRYHSTSIGMVMKVFRYIENVKEIYYILTPFDVGVEFDESKFGSTTVKDIQNSYFGDADQFVSTLLISNIHIYGAADKDYMVIRGKNKNKKVKLFLFDTSTKKELEKMINEYQA